MQITFIDTHDLWDRMLPLSYTRPVSDLRVGTLKIWEKWAHHLNVDGIFHRTAEYLTHKFDAPDDKCLTIKGNVLPTAKVVATVKGLEDHQAIIHNSHLIAGFFAPKEKFSIGSREVIEVSHSESIDHPWDIFKINGQQIREDYELITRGHDSLPIRDMHTKIYGDQIFLDEDACVKACILNAENGPIYIGKHAHVQEGAIIKGPFSLGDHSHINMGAKIQGDVTAGPHSKVGGEVSNSVIQGYSNKAHDGFLGNSVIGEWCNLGAGTNNSNLKNNYANVKMWDFETQRFKDTGMQFCGLIMGDHSKCGINTMFNTGTTVGVFANIFGDGFPGNFIPSFAWGGASGFATYQTKKVFETAELVMIKKGKEMGVDDKAVLSHIFETTAQYRDWEKN